MKDDKRFIFTKQSSGFREPLCWCVAGLIWLAVLNSPQLWELVQRVFK